MKNILLSLFIATTLVLFAVALRPKAINQSIDPLGGAVEINEATTTSAIAIGFSQLKSSSAVVGSVVVASTSATTLTLWNATSTTDTASSTITTLKASVGEGTYTLNSSAPRGLIIELPTGFNGDYVVTWR